MVCDGAARTPHAEPAARQGPRPEAALAPGHAGAVRRWPRRNVVRGGRACRAHRPDVPDGARPPARTGHLGAGRLPGALAIGVAEQLFAGAPVVVVANAGDPAGLPVAATRAERAHAPLLLTSPGAGAPSGSAAIRAAVRALGTRAVLAVGITQEELAAQLSGIRGVRVTANPARLPATRAPAPLRHVVLLVHQGGPGSAGTAVAATAQVAGVQVIAVRGYDPRADPGAITALAAARPREVLAVGARFGPPGLLAARVAVAETGVQLPGGGQLLVPLHRLVALYGHPGTPSLGALGEQGLTASIARARQMAAPYRPLSQVPVIPAFEIIATVARGIPRPGRQLLLRDPAVRPAPVGAAGDRAGMYVVLDLQPGRASLLAQAKLYQPLLERPNVGLALDPEWKLRRASCR